MHRGLLALSRFRTLACAVLLAAALLAALPAVTLPRTRPDSPDIPAASAQMPDALLPRLNATLAADDPAYTITTDNAGTLRAANPAHGLATAFTPSGLAFVPDAGPQWSLRLAAVGDDAPPIVAPVAAGQRIEYRRGNLTEWYVNGPLGIEQGFTLAAPLATGDALTVTMHIGGATPRMDGSNVTLALPDGSALAYGHLAVTDAAGRRLPARLSIAGEAITIHTDLAGAAYPVTVDPLIEQKKLIASDGGSGDRFGTSVAMSSDGSRVIVGAYLANVGKGAAYVYSGANYATEKRLTASDGAANDSFGQAVAMSADGTTVIVGASGKQIGANGGQGAAYIYSGANYATEKRLVASDGATNDYFGYAVGMSGDGAKVIVGAYHKKIGQQQIQGAAYVYSGANYATEKRLTASDGGALEYFGGSVAMSGDGATVIVGTPYKLIGAPGNFPGAVYIYSGSTYGTEQRLTASDGVDGDRFGFSVAMNGDGTKVIVSAYFKKINTSTYQGAAYVYSGAGYATEKRLTASDGATNDEFGWSVAMSGDGATVIVGSYKKIISGKGYQGQAYVYSGANYAAEQRLTASDGQGGYDFGYAVAMNDGGTKAIIGAYGTFVTASNQGAAYIFGAAVVPPNPLPPAKPGSGSGSPGPMPGPKPGTGTGNPSPLPPPRP